MESTVSVTELFRTLADVLARIRYRRERFIIEQNGTPVTRMVPVDSTEAPTLADALSAWSSAAPHDPTFADDLERVNAADRAPLNP